MRITGSGYPKNQMVPGIINEISLKPFSLNFLYGLRQVGKTVAVKLLIKKLLDDGREEKSVFYFRCDSISGMRKV